MNTPISFRRCTDADLNFLFRVFASTRQDITFSTIPEQQKQMLMQQQFQAQTLHYAKEFGSADFLIVMQGKAQIGRLTVNRSDDEIRVVDIAILPEWRGKGIGTKIISDLLNEGHVSDKPVRLHAEKAQRVVDFYKRLGFVVVNELEMHFFMECTPSGKLIV